MWLTAPGAHTLNSKSESQPIVSVALAADITESVIWVRASVHCPSVIRDAADVSHPGRYLVSLQWLSTVLGVKLSVARVNCSHRLVRQSPEGPEPVSFTAYTGVISRPAWGLCHWQSPWPLARAGCQWHCPWQAARTADHAMTWLSQCTSSQLETCKTVDNMERHSHWVPSRFTLTWPGAWSSQVTTHWTSPVPKNSNMRQLSPAPAAVSALASLRQCT